MNRLISVSLFLTLLSSGFAVAARTCETDSARYAELNRTIIIEPNDDVTAANYSKVRDIVTEQLRTLVEYQVIEELTSGSFAQVGNITSRIKCLQAGLPHYNRTSNVTNVPAAILLNGKDAAVVVAFEIYRGGVGAPDLLPVIEVFSQKGGTWRVVAIAGADYAGSTFYLQQLTSRKKDEDWFLLWGRPLGATGVGSHLEVLGFDGLAFHIVSQETLPSGVIVEEVTPDHLIVSGETKNDRGRAYEYHSRYDVVPEGLKHTSKVVTNKF